MFLIAFFLLFSYWSQEPGKEPDLRIVDPVKFDEWHDLVFSDEKARLDNISIVWKAHSQNIIYLVIYAGERACVSEAKARGIRAKNYLMKRNVPASNIVWIDGGWKNEVTTEVWIWPPRFETPSIFPEFNLKASEVTFEKGCKIKYRGARVSSRPRLTSAWSELANERTPLVSCVGERLNRSIELLRRMQGRRTSYANLESLHLGCLRNIRSGIGN